VFPRCGQVRYVRFFLANPTYVDSVMMAFLDERGVLNPDSTVRAMTPHLLLRFVKQTAKVPTSGDRVRYADIMLGIVGSPPLSSRQGLTARGETNGSRRANGRAREDDAHGLRPERIHLFEACGVLLGADPAPLQRAQEQLLLLLQRPVERLEALSKQTMVSSSADSHSFDGRAPLADDLLDGAADAAFQISAVAVVSKGCTALSRESTPLREIFSRATHAALMAMAAFGAVNDVRAKVLVLLHRMVETLGETVLPYLDSAVPQLLRRADATELVEVSVATLLCTTLPSARDPILCATLPLHAHRATSRASLCGRATYVACAASCVYDAQLLTLVNQLVLKFKSNIRGPMTVLFSPLAAAAFAHLHALETAIAASSAACIGVVGPASDEVRERRGLLRSFFSLVHSLVHSDLTQVPARCSGARLHTRARGSCTQPRLVRRCQAPGQPSAQVLEAPPNAEHVPSILRVLLSGCGPNTRAKRPPTRSTAAASPSPGHTRQPPSFVSLWAGLEGPDLHLQRQCFVILQCLVESWVGSAPVRATTFEAACPDHRFPLPRPCWLIAAPDVFPGVRHICAARGAACLLLGSGAAALLCQRRCCTRTPRIECRAAEGHPCQAGSGSRGLFARRITAVARMHCRGAQAHPHRHQPATLNRSQGEFAYRSTAGSIACVYRSRPNSFAPSATRTCAICVISSRPMHVSGVALNLNPFPFQPVPGYW
jgi:hypothetical protein